MIDAPNDEAFDEMLAPLVERWNDREVHLRKLRNTKDAKFGDYFVNNISLDMKRKMILPVRRELMQYGDNFFYNNASESVNDRIKKIVKQRNATQTSSGRPKTKCTWVEFAALYKVSFLFGPTPVAVL